jgi:hypothetical protein
MIPGFSQRVGEKSVYQSLTEKGETKSHISVITSVAVVESDRFLRQVHAAMALQSNLNRFSRG